MFPWLHGSFKALHEFVQGIVVVCANKFWALSSHLAEEACSSRSNSGARVSTLFKHPINYDLELLQSLFTRTNCGRIQSCKCGMKWDPRSTLLSRSNTLTYILPCDLYQIIFDNRSQTRKSGCARNRQRTLDVIIKILINAIILELNFSDTFEQEDCKLLPVPITVIEEQEVFVWLIEVFHMLVFFFKK